MSISAISSTTDNSLVYSVQGSGGIRTQSLQGSTDFAEALQSVEAMQSTQTSPTVTLLTGVQPDSATNAAGTSLAGGTTEQGQQTEGTSVTTGVSSGSTGESGAASSGLISSFQDALAALFGGTASNSEGGESASGSAAEAETQTALSGLKETVESMGYLVVLNSAVQLFSSLSQYIANALTAQNQTEQPSASASQYTFADDFSELGQALQVGDLPKAQQTFSNLQRNLLATSSLMHYGYSQGADWLGSTVTTHSTETQSGTGTLDLST